MIVVPVVVVAVVEQMSLVVDVDVHVCCLLTRCYCGGRCRCRADEPGG